MKPIKIRCTKCGFTGTPEDFSVDYKSYEPIPYVASCPQCDNWQPPIDPVLPVAGTYGKKKPPFEIVPPVG